MQIQMNGREGGIRTHDLLVPNQALYQTEPLPDTGNNNGRGEKIRTSDPLHPMQVR